MCRSEGGVTYLNLEGMTLVGVKPYLGEARVFTVG